MLAAEHSTTQFIQRLEAMRVRLPTLLIFVNVALMVIVLFGVGLVARQLVGGFADDQGLARVNQSVQIARNDINQTAAQSQTDARVLAERPTLARLLVADDRTGLTAFIEQFRQTSALDGVAVWRGQTLVAQTAGVLPPTALSGSPTLVISTTQLSIVAQADVATQSSTSVVIWRNLDAAFMQRLSTTLDLAAATYLPDASQQPIVQQTLATRQPQTMRTANAYVGVAPLFAADQTVVGVVDVRLPTNQIEAASQRLSTTLLLVILGVVVIAAFINSAIGRYVGTPLQRLTHAAARIGHGDLTTPVPQHRGVEVGLLATTLENMRQQLNTLTNNLRRQQAEANAILSGIVEGVYTVDRERRIRYVNPQAAKMLNLDPANVVGQFCGDVLRPLEQHGERPCVNQCPIIHARFRGTARTVEHLQHADGTRRTVIITSSNSHDGLQVQVIRDETDIEAARRLRDTMLATISHEFRTPLSAQLASLELLQDQLGQLSHAQMQQLLLSLQRGALRLTYLIDNLLESARIEAGQLAIRRSSITLDGVLDDALDMMRPLLHQRRQEIQLDLPYPLPPLVGDATRLTQVFVNLLANASKFAPQDSHISIGGNVLSHSVQLWVDDQGPGLPAGAGESPFRLFVRARTEPEQSGTGLGLWIVQSIVERHGGKLIVPHRDHGTRIIVELPIESRANNAGGDSG